MTPTPRISRKPYLLRAMHQWMTDSGFTPHVIVKADAEGADLPLAYASEGKIVLNISYSATQNLDLANDWIAFQARFSGVVQQVRFPVAAVLGVYARETGEGMVFSEQDNVPPPTGPGGGTTPEETRPRPQLKVVK
jgi:stringent starvation protein B